jgi:hypothetical protein
MREPPSHPFSVGRVFELAGGLFSRRWLTLYAAAAAFLVPAYAFMDLAASTFAPRFYVWVGQAQQAILSNTSFPPLPADTPVAVTALAAAVIVLLATGAAAGAAIIHAADATYRGDSAPLGASVRRALVRLPAIAGGMAIYYLIGAGIALAVCLPGSLLVLVGGFVAFVGLIIVVGGFAALVLLGVRVTLLQQAIVLENLGPVAAFRRSWRLSIGAGWRVLGYTVLVALLNGMVGFFISGTPEAVFSLHPEIPRDVAITTVLDGLVALIVAPLTPLVFTLLYYDLRWQAGEPPVPAPLRAEGDSVPEQQI